MAGLLVADVERVVFVAEDQRQVATDEAAVAADGAALAAVGPELLHGDAYRDARLAAVAAGPVGEAAAAPEACTHQFAIVVGVDGGSRFGHLRAGEAVGQVAAGKGGRDV